MRRALRDINYTTIAGGFGLLLLSVWPGYVVGCWLIFAYPLTLALGVAWCFVVWRGTRRKAASPVTARAVLVAPIVVCITYALLVLYVPRRVVFAAFAGQFEAHVAGAPVGRPAKPLNERLGIYQVDEYAADPRGGVYFRTGWTGDGIGPDRLSFGFAYRPNTEGSPFGSKYYAPRRLFGQWYWFKASDDF